MIDYRDISVVVQGPIEHVDNITKKVCDDVRRVLPGSEIILSTWEGSDSEGIDYDYLVINPNIKANRIIMPWTDIDKLHTINHQLITTLNGIKRCGRKYVLKLRSDTTVLSDNFINFYEKYTKYPTDDNIQWKIFSHRIVCLPTYNVKRANGLPYNICDWVFFGKFSDLYDLFNIPLVDTYNLFVRDGEKYPRVEDNFGSEQIIWIECLQKHRNVEIKNAVDKNANIIEDFEKSLANNFITISAKLFGIYNMKYGYGAYARDPYLSHGFYTLTEWECLYNKYGGGNIKIPFRFKERVIYPIYLAKDQMMRFALFNKMYTSFLKIARSFGEKND